MAALVTLAVAKGHLRIAPEDISADADLTAKIAQASATVIRYLTRRLTAIASISVANPTVITTTGPHSLTSGVTHAILGTTTTPTVNGAQVVTVLTPTTFSVPVNVTVGQSTEAGTVGAPTWTEPTLPPEVQAAILTLLAQLVAFRGDGDVRPDDTQWQSKVALLREPVVA